jgi:hypothetical protein
MFQPFWLVVLTIFNHLEKYEFVNGKDDIAYMKWEIIHEWEGYMENTCEMGNNFIYGNGKDDIPYMENKFMFQTTSITNWINYLRHTSIEETTTLPQLWYDGAP